MRSAAAIVYFVILEINESGGAVVLLSGLRRRGRFPVWGWDLLLEAFALFSRDFAVLDLQVEESGNLWAVPGIMEPAFARCWLRIRSTRMRLMSKAEREMDDATEAIPAGLMRAWRQLAQGKARVNLWVVPNERNTVLVNGTISSSASATAAAAAAATLATTATSESPKGESSLRLDERLNRRRRHLLGRAYRRW